MFDHYLGAIETKIKSKVILLVQKDAFHFCDK